MEENRVDKAVALFKEGYNCAQAVTAAYADLFGMDKETALKVSASFGGGMGRMRQVCGAVSGMFLINGLANGSVSACDKEAKKNNYAMVQQLARAFMQENGSINCGELLSNTLPKAQIEDRNPESAERTAAYYLKRPCVEYVRYCACLIEKYILNTK